MSPAAEEAWRRSEEYASFAVDNLSSVVSRKPIRFQARFLFPQLKDAQIDDVVQCLSLRGRPDRIDSVTEGLEARFEQARAHLSTVQQEILMERIFARPSDARLGRVLV